MSVALWHTNCNCAKRNPKPCAKCDFHASYVSVAAVELQREKKKDAEMSRHSTWVSSEDPGDALRSLGSVRFVARPLALFWSDWGWSVCVLSIGAFGVTEVSGLRVFLCEAAALRSPAAPLPWCGASVYLKAECKFTTLVVNQTSGSQNTRAQCDISIVKQNMIKLEGAQCSV